MLTKIWERAITEKLKKPSPILPIRWREIRNAFPIIHWALPNRPKIPEILAGTSNGMDRFGLLRPKFEGAWSTLTGRNEMFLFIWPNCCPPYHSFVSCLQCKNNNQTSGGLGRVCANVVTVSFHWARGISEIEFQTGILFNRKSPLSP